MVPGQLLMVLRPTVLYGRVGKSDEYLGRVQFQMNGAGSSGGNDGCRLGS